MRPGRTGIAQSLGVLRGVLVVAPWPAAIATGSGKSPFLTVLLRGRPVGITLPFTTKGGAVPKGSVSTFKEPPVAPHEEGSWRLFLFHSGSEQHISFAILGNHLAIP